MDVPDDTDNLLRAVAGADRAAFRALYDQAGQKLFGIALRICGERSLAEDALQDAFAEIWRKAAEFDPDRGRAMAWMAVIIRNRSIDTIRRRARNPAHGGGGEEDFLAIADGTKPLDGGVEHMALVECLRRLEAADREAVLLAYYKGFSREELAARFDAPVNTMKTRLRRALALLRGCLDE